MSQTGSRWPSLLDLLVSLLVRSQHWSVVGVGAWRVGGAALVAATIRMTRNFEAKFDKIIEGIGDLTALA